MKIQNITFVRTADRKAFHAKAEGLLSVRTLFVMAAAGMLCKLFVPEISAMISTWGLCILLYFLSVCDIRTLRIPNRFLTAAIGVWGIGRLCAGVLDEGTIRLHTIKEMAMAMILGAAMYLCLIVIAAFAQRLLHRKALGGGDSKLISVSSLYLGFSNTLTMLFLACLFGLFTWMLARGRRACGPMSKEQFLHTPRRKHTEVFPLGPAISLAIVLELLFRL